MVGKTGTAANHLLEVINDIPRSGRVSRGTLRNFIPGEFDRAEMASGCRSCSRSRQDKGSIFR